jgi:virginiamycin B lyase
MERADAQVRARPAPGPDGNIYIAVMNGNKMRNSTPSRRRSRSGSCPTVRGRTDLSSRPTEKSFYTGNGNGSIGELDPATGKVIDHFTPRRAGIRIPRCSTPKATSGSRAGRGYLGKLDRKSGKVSEIPMPGGPYGLAIDKQGRIWVCRMGANALGIYDPKTGKTDELRTGSARVLAALQQRRTACCGSRTTETASSPRSIPRR